MCVFAGSIHGASKHARVISVKILGQGESGSLLWVLEGIDWIQRRIMEKDHSNVRSVINMSFGIIDIEGYLSFLDSCFADVPAIIVAAAGNECIDACLVAPASFESVITVGATTRNDKLLYYNATIGTNYGPCVDVLAPGTFIVSAGFSGTTSESTKSGTSMSAAYVSGVVARYMQNFRRQPTSWHMRRMLQETATQGKTNAATRNTSDFLLYAGCQSEEYNAFSIFKSFTTNSTDCMSYNPPLTPLPQALQIPQKAWFRNPSVLILGFFAVMCITGLAIGITVLKRVGKGPDNIFMVAPTPETDGYITT